MLTSLTAFASACDQTAWPLWTQYSQQFIQADGRVLNSSLKAQHSTSEGQSYAMFFALVANDQPLFDKLWRWTISNMASGQIDKHLPGWLWGQGDDHKWAIQDANSATDADLWFAYVLLEAARLWHRPDYQSDAEHLLANIASHQTVTLPGFGRMLLPGPEGFIMSDHLWRLNPSYLPIPVLRRLTKEAPAGPWKEITENTARLLHEVSHNGFIADWVGYRGTAAKKGLFVTDPVAGPLGSYDAIRVYLWAGMTAKTDPLAAPILASLNGMAMATASTGVPPEKVQVSNGSTQGVGPFGFSAALIPYFQAKGQPWLAELQQHRVEQSLEQAQDPLNKQTAQLRYYDYMLSLFALGWTENRYQFLDDGTLQLPWENACSPASTH
ncbi:endoglucanase [Pseudomonas sp. GGS8]|uniref:cellulose synthase complex periplasmic endoglucanase BcsZ n=1 Tax=Pseudomonas sp. GGS8 TaxID=2817892 RepID=UPI00209F4E72|nr:cellulose synthase complex periplasmic endoglucanase BcsZ [Pseudomonas sp. GGS8]MCP1446030.1 endoglucanase [Pseudomonas sp. GGS8]